MPFKSRGRSIVLAYLIVGLMPDPFRTQADTVSAPYKSGHKCRPGPASDRLTAAPLIGASPEPFCSVIIQKSCSARALTVRRTAGYADRNDSAWRALQTARWHVAACLPHSGRPYNLE